MHFDDRESAGRLLADRLHFLHGEDVVVQGVARGGVIVAAEVARALQAPLETVLVGKVTAPQAPDLALGAVSEDETLVLNHDVVRRLGLDRAMLGYAVSHARNDLLPRVQSFRRHRRPRTLRGRTVVLVDDGLATGASARAAIGTLRGRGADRIVLAVPVAPITTLGAVATQVEQTNCPSPLRWMRSVGSAYVDFPRLHDTEVLARLRDHAAARVQTRRSRVPVPAQRDRHPSCASAR